MCPKVDFSFDERVARRYDHQRAHPAHVSQQIGEAITKAANGGRVLEIGVGTGRIAKPVAAAGCEVIGFDLSQHMLSEVGVGAVGALHVFRGDMHTIPFPANTFDAVLAVHVLHLSQDWQAVLREAARVLKPGGVFIQGDDWIAPDSIIGQLRDEMRRQALKRMPEMMPPGARANRQQVLSELGGGDMHEVIAAEWTTELSPEDRLQTIEAKQDSESWILGEEMFIEVVPELRAYAQATWGDLNIPQQIQRRFVLKITPGEWASVF